MKKKKMLHKLQKTQKALIKFILQTTKNYQTMKTTIKKIWVAAIACVLILSGMTACNVTRVITNESQYYQRGDTAVTIQTKTVETYDATKKGR